MMFVWHLVNDLAQFRPELGQGLARNGTRSVDDDCDGVDALGGYREARVDEAAVGRAPAMVAAGGVGHVASQQRPAVERARVGVSNRFLDAARGFALGLGDLRAWCMASSQACCDLALGGPEWPPDNQRLVGLDRQGKDLGQFARAYRVVRGDLLGKGMDVLRVARNLRGGRPPRPPDRVPPEARLRPFVTLECTAWIAGGLRGKAWADAPSASRLLAPRLIGSAVDVPENLRAGRTIARDAGRGLLCRRCGVDI